MEMEGRSFLLLLWTGLRSWDAKVLPLNIYLYIVSYTPSFKAVYSIGSSCHKFDSTIAVRHSFVWSLVALAIGYSDSLDCILFAAHPLLL